MLKPYFPPRAGDPTPLRAVVARRVRFEEVDPLGIVWHGRYPGYFEDARVALGDRYGLGYMEMYRQGVVAPLRKLHCDYHRPLHFQDDFTIEGVLHWSDAVRLNHEFIIRNAAGQVTTTGYSVQMLLDHEENVLLVPPPFMAAFRERWQRGELS
ncbi:MAG: acyl-CoA thioesterase [Desulfuromonadales bacterium]